jgi:hypothetical protein
LRGQTMAAQTPLCLKFEPSENDALEIKGSK